MSNVNFPTGLAIKASTNPDDTNDPERLTQDVENFGIAGRIWEGAYLLQRYLRPPSPSIEFDPPCPIFQRDNLATPRIIVELGSGTGYTGLKLAKLLAPDDTVILTDLPEVCPLLLTNVHDLEGPHANKPHVTESANIWVRELAWGNRINADAIAQDLVTEYGSSTIHYVLCSDLVYFPTLLPLLLRTLIRLTEPTFCKDGQPPVIIISYKMRSLAFESPFWSAFGSYFSFEPIFAQSALPDPPHSTGWNRFGSTKEIENESFIFLATRKKESLSWDVPESNQELMFARGDMTFESILLLSMDAS